MSGERDLFKGRELKWYVEPRKPVPPCKRYPIAYFKSQRVTFSDDPATSATNMKRARSEEEEEEEVKVAPGPKKFCTCSNPHNQSARESIERRRVIRRAIGKLYSEKTWEANNEARHLDVTFASFIVKPLFDQGWIKEISPETADKSICKNEFAEELLWIVNVGLSAAERLDSTVEQSF